MGIFDKLFKKKPEKPETRKHCTVCGRAVNDVYFDRFDVQDEIGYSMKIGEIINVIELERSTQFAPIRLTDKNKKPLGYITNHSELVSNINLILSKPYLVCKNCGATICIGCSELSHFTILHQWSNPDPWKNHPNCPECGSDKELLFQYSFHHIGTVPYNKSEIMNYRMFELELIKKKHNWKW